MLRTNDIVKAKSSFYKQYVFKKLVTNVLNKTGKGYSQ